MNKKRNFKLVVIGDHGVGKTSFITALIQDDQRNNRVPQLGPVQLPADMFQNVECNTIIFDTTSKLGQIPPEVMQADVILLMYDIADYNSAERLRGFWLKEIYNQNLKQPIIVVGNKLDLLDTIQDDDFEFQRIFKVIKPLVREFNRVEMGIECSAQSKRGILDVVNCAQRSFLYPLAPIYNLVDKCLTINFRKALTRIFRACDKDGDGQWSDMELMRFQKKVFKRQLDSFDIRGIKDMIQEELKNNSSNINITIDGFIALQKRGIELMKIQICWTILRHFQYGDDLKLNEEIFQNEMIIDKEAGQTVELSDRGIVFLKQIFKQFRKDKLKQEDIDVILFPVMIEHNFPSMDYIHNYSADDGINCEQWISLWNAYVYNNYQESYKLIKYIGYDGKLSDCFKETNKKDAWSSAQKIIDRKVFSVAFIVSIVYKKTIKEQLFKNRSVVVLPYNTKTYVVTLVDTKEAEIFHQKQNLGAVDFIILEEGLAFQMESIVPTIIERLEKSQLSLPEFIERIAVQIHQHPFGFSELQVKQLKQQNGFQTEIISIFLCILFLSGGVLGYYKLKGRK